MTLNEQNLVILDVEESIAAKETPSIMSYIKGFFKNA